MKANPKKQIGLLATLVLCMGLPSCHESGQQHTQAVKEEIRSRKPIHLSDAQITERAFELGDTLCDLAEAGFLFHLKTDTGSCEPAFQATASELAARHSAQVKRISFRDEELKTITSKKEKEVLEACFYNRTHRLRIDPNLQKDSEKEFVFTRALTLTDAKCLKCHQAKMGDTLGMWDVRLARKQVVLSFVE